MTVAIMAAVSCIWMHGEGMAQALLSLISMAVVPTAAEPSASSLGRGAPPGAERVTMHT